MTPVDLRLEHLPADALGLADAARRALRDGVLGGIPVVRRTADIGRPADRHDPGARTLLAQALRRGLDAVDVPDRTQTLSPNEFR